MSSGSELLSLVKYYQCPFPSPRLSCLNIQLAGIGTLGLSNMGNNLMGIIDFLTSAPQKVTPLPHTHIPISLSKFVQDLVFVKRGKLPKKTRKVIHLQKCRGSPFPCYHCKLNICHSFICKYPLSPCSVPAPRAKKQAQTFFQIVIKV